MDKCTDGTHFDIAIILKTMYMDQYKCTSLKFKTWYEYIGHRWKEIDEGHTLYTKISTELTKDFTLIISKIWEKISKEKDKEEVEKLTKKAEMNKRIVKSLKTRSFKRDVIAEARVLFLDEVFKEKADENRDLIGFNNGVYDLAKHTFRKGSPDDYVTMCTHIDYIPFDKSSQEVKDTMDFFKKIQPNREMRKYILGLLASYLQGHTPDEKFHIWTGTGANGKSKCIELVQMTFGDYAGTLPTSLITQKRAAAGAAQPELANTKGQRFCVFQEPEQNDKIRVGLMKELTGGDSITARKLYHEPITFKPQFKLLLTCNKLPEIPAADGGTWRRLRVVEFKSKFVANPVNKYEFQRDEYLSTKFLKWKSAFMSILLEEFKDYKENGLNEPEEVIKFTKKYQQGSDSCLEFLTETIEETKNEGDCISITGLFAMYRSWYKDYYSEQTTMKRPEFAEYIEGKYEHVRNKTVYYVMVKSKEDVLVANLN
jgi:P4 family phage/plasmid primase-like protien